MKINQSPGFELKNKRFQKLELGHHWRVSVIYFHTRISKYFWCQNLIFSNYRNNQSKDKKKDKSLVELFKKFMKTYGRFSNNLIALDSWANTLQIEKRRVYDILNIFEAFNSVKKKAKNLYIWKGAGSIYRALEIIQQKCALVKTAKNAENKNVNLNSNESSSDELLKLYKWDNTKSLGFLWESFICLFMLYKPVLTLEEAATKISTIFLNNSKLKTKVRRLYDIANVLSVLKIIKKTFIPSGKAAFEWVGQPGFEDFLSEIEKDSTMDPKANVNFAITKTIESTTPK